MMDPLPPSHEWAQDLTFEEFQQTWLPLPETDLELRTGGESGLKSVQGVFGMIGDFFVFFPKLFTTWWFQISFSFTPIPGKIIQFDEDMFQMGGKQPPTSFFLLVFRVVFNACLLFKIQLVLCALFF